MRVLIVSEGVSETGRADYAASLEILVTRLRGHGLACAAITFRDMPKVHGGVKGGGMFKKAVRCMIHAVENGFNAVVVVVDEDGDHSRVGQFRDAQAYGRLTIQRAMGIAIPTFDAWMLADELALKEVLGAVIAMQPDPEKIRDAKGVCKRLREEHGCEMGMSAFYSSVAGHARLDVWEDRCADGFGVFAERVRKM